jgi:enoyl-CoA hydratase/carnithine racemase
MTSDTIHCEVKEGIATLTLNRPEVMNALNFEIVRALDEHLARMRFDTAVRVVILTGAGEKAFCAGADLKERATLSPEQVKDFLFLLGRVFEAIEHYTKPVIAAVNGVAFGGGLEMALAADIRLAAEGAVVGLTETRLAIIPGGGGTQRLPRLIGVGKAKELIFTGRRISAAQALAIGLVNQVSPADQLLVNARQLAAEICAGGPIAVQQAKYAIDAGLQSDLHTGLAIEANAYQICIPTEDRLEGLAAFKEKRKPVYKGR